MCQQLHFLTDFVLSSHLVPRPAPQVIFRALTPANKIEDPYSPEAQDLLKLTNLRLLLLKRQECPCQNSGWLEKPHRFAHYAIYDLIVRGSCFCNGHAEECQHANRTGVDNVVSIGASLTHAMWKEGRRLWGKSHAFIKVISFVSCGYAAIGHSPLGVAMVKKLLQIDVPDMSP